MNHNNEKGLYYLAGIGHTPPTIRKVWMGENDDDYSPGKIAIISQIDLLIAKANITPTTAKANIYNQLDLYSTLLHGYEHIARGDQHIMQTIGKAVGQMKHRQEFNHKSTTLAERQQRLDELKEILQQTINADTDEPYDKHIYQWCIQQVAHRMQPTSISGRRGREEEAINKLKESGTFYLYRYLNGEQLQQAKSIVKNKLNTQNQTHSYIREHNRYFNVIEQDNFIRAGIIERTQNEPEVVLRYMIRTGARIEGHNQQIGSIVLGTIVTLIGAITSLLGILWDMFGKKRNPPTAEELKKAMASGTDFDPPTPPNTTTDQEEPTGKTSVNKKSTSNSLPILAGVGILLLLFKKKKK